MGEKKPEILESLKIEGKKIRVNSKWRCTFSKYKTLWLGWGKQKSLDFQLKRDFYEDASLLTLFTRQAWLTGHRYQADLLYEGRLWYCASNRWDKVLLLGGEIQTNSISPPLSAQVDKTGYRWTLKFWNISVTISLWNLLSIPFFFFFTASFFF